MKILYVTLAAAIASSTSNAHVSPNFLKEQKTGWFYYPAKQQPEEQEEKQPKPIVVQPKPSEENSAKKASLKKQTTIKVSDEQLPQMGAERSEEEQQLLKDKIFIQNILDHPADFSDYSSKRLEKDFEEAKRIALDRPTRHNVHAVQKLNLAINQRAHKFANAWAYNVTAHPELVAKGVSISGGMGDYQRALRHDQFSKGYKKLLKDGLELVYFYEGSNKEHIGRNFAVVQSEFPDAKLTFIDVERNRAIAEQYPVREYPSLWAHIKGGELKHLFSGVVFIEQAKEALRQQFSNYFEDNPYTLVE